MDENTINRVVLEMITEEMETVYDVVGFPDTQKVLIGQIYGITLLAKALKEELKGE